jgi:hypothetical protein
MKRKHYLQVGVTDFKLDKTTGEFTCYGNVKGNIDHALDRTLDGAYQNSIDEHMKNGTMPKMFWMHKAYDLPVGVWLEMKEDQKGLWLKGRLSDTTMGRDIEALAKDGALDSFSIGYYVAQEKWNQELHCNDLIELDIKEVSWVTYACNEESLLQDIKSKMDEGDLPTVRELEKFLRDNGFSKKQAERIVSKYRPDNENVDAWAELAKVWNSN